MDKTKTPIKNGLNKWVAANRKTKKRKAVILTGKNLTPKKSKGIK